MLSAISRLAALAVITSTQFALIASDGPAGVPAPGAPASPGGAAPEGLPGAGMMQFLLIGGFVLMMYFLLIRPQKKQEAKRKAMIEAVKVGDKVVTIGGVHGTVVRRGENTVDLEVAKDVVITFNAGAIGEAPDVKKA